MIYRVIISVRLKVYNGQVPISPDFAFAHLTIYHRPIIILLCCSCINLFYMTLQDFTSIHFPSIPFRPTTLCPPTQILLSFHSGFCFTKSLASTPPGVASCCPCAKGGTGAY
jgi:hypothetical protein